MNKALKLIEDFRIQEEMKHIKPRYITDIRGGCGAIRDRWHIDYNESYPGLHSDTSDVVSGSYKHGFRTSDGWDMNPSDIEEIEKMCDELNKNLS